MVLLTLSKVWDEPVNLCDDINDKHAFGGLAPFFVAVNSQIAVAEIYIEWGEPITSDLSLFLKSSLIEKTQYNPHQEMFLIVERAPPPSLLPSATKQIKTVLMNLTKAIAKDDYVASDDDADDDDDIDDEDVVDDQLDTGETSRGENVTINTKTPVSKLHKKGKKDRTGERHFYHLRPSSRLYYNIHCARLDDAKFTLKKNIIDGKQQQKPITVRKLILKFDIIQA